MEAVNLSNIEPSILDNTGYNAIRKIFKVSHCSAEEMLFYPGS